MTRSKRRSRGSSGQGELVDLPLTPPDAEPEVVEAESTAGNLSLFPNLDDPPVDGGLDDSPDRLGAAEEVLEGALTPEETLEPPAGEEAAVRAPRPATAARRLLGALADLVVHLAVLAGGVTAMAFLGLEPRLEDLPGLILYLLSFSFLYTVVPLAFWGQTPGMAWVGIKATDRGRRPLTFGQTALRWVSALLSVALAGLPLLLSLTRRSFSDRLSGSESWQDLEAAAFLHRGTNDA